MSSSVTDIWLFYYFADLARAEESKKKKEKKKKKKKLRDVRSHIFAQTTHQRCGVGSRT